MKNDYLNVVKQRIKDKNTQNQVYAELEGHIQDKIGYYKELGYSDDDAEKRAVEDMGEPDDAALPLRSLHSGAGRDWFVFIAVLFFAATVIVPFFFHKFNYADTYYRAVYHLITVDFLSVAVIAGYVFFLIKAFRIKSKVIPFSAAAALIISIFNGIVIFRPAVYAVVKLFTKGFGGYTDNVFAYAYFTDDMHLPLTVGPYVIFAILLAWAVVQFISVFMQERMYNTKKLNGAVNIIRRVTAALICAELLIMTVCTVTAAFYLPQKREALHQERIKMINEVINTSGNDLSSAKMLAEGYTPYGVMPPLNTETEGYAFAPNYYLESVFYGLVGNNTFITISGSGAYARTDFDLPFDALENYVVDSKLLYNNEHDNLQTFLDEGWYDKALMVYKSYGQDTELISFTFYTSDNRSDSITFECPEKDLTENNDLSKFIFRGTGGFYDTNGGII